MGILQKKNQVIRALMLLLQAEVGSEPVRQVQGSRCFLSSVCVPPHDSVAALLLLQELIRGGCVKYRDSGALSPASVSS